MRTRIVAAAGVTLALIALLVSIAGARRQAVRHRAPTVQKRHFTTSVSYTETDPGKTRGADTVGIVGHGRFSAKLTPRGALEALIASVATGIPILKIVRGGSYVVQLDATVSGFTGLLVAKFSASGLGTACVSFDEKSGKFMPGESFVPVSGSFKMVGGTGQAARWRGSVTFTQTKVTGASTEQFSGHGLERGSVGKPRRLTAACRRVARL